MTTVTTSPPPATSSVAGSNTSTDAEALLGDWQTIRNDGDIQFAPVDVTPTQSEMPDWLRNALNAIGEFVLELLGPVGGFLAASWPVTKWVLAALLALGLLYLLYTIFEPYLSIHRRSAEPEEQWTPERAQALALLADADRLAQDGRYDEATRLLLHRSVGQISAVRPDWIDPSSTAREIASLSALPESARTAFAAIAERVERSLFALRSLGAEDWRIARAAYADFALQQLTTRT